MQAGRALNRLVARHVLRRNVWIFPARYSTDMRAAWQVVAMMARRGWTAEIRTPLVAGDVYVCGFVPRGVPEGSIRPRNHYAQAETLPLAICLGALSALRIALPE